MVVPPLLSPIPAAGTPKGGEGVCVMGCLTKGQAVLRKSSLLPQTRPDSKQFLPECGKVSGNSEDSG
jgi:hypothetical protein